eukprot:s1579_g19.t1
MHGVPSASQRKASATAADCRYTRKGRFSAWLIKGKSDGVKAKWFQSLGRRCAPKIQSAAAKSRGNRVESVGHDRDCRHDPTMAEADGQDDALGAAAQGHSEGSALAKTSRPQPACATDSD